MSPLPEPLRSLPGYRLARELAYWGAQLPAWAFAGQIPPEVWRAYHRQLLPARRRIEPLRPWTTYVFVFLGEFGYELLNWQGIVRRFAERLPAGSRIVVAGRRGLASWYESASAYVDLSDFAPFQDSVAAGYFAVPADQPGRRLPPSARELAFDAALRRAIRAEVLRRLELHDGSNVRCIFSSELTAFPDCAFGVDRHWYGRRGSRGNIYGASDLLRDNTYRRLEPVCEDHAGLERQLGQGLEEPYALVQLRRREVGPQAGGVLDERRVINALARRMPVAVLSFDTGRLRDSGSWARVPHLGREVRVADFTQQSCLISHARRCVFLTEGDFGSHLYVPPMLGHDVIAVASRQVLAQPSAAAAFWNARVFQFGGQLRPQAAEEALRSEEALAHAAGTWLRGVEGAVACPVS